MQPSSNLKGSDKQIQWAQKICASTIGPIRHTLEQTFPEFAPAAISALEQIESAKFWIENQPTSFLALGLYGVYSAGLKLGLPKDNPWFSYSWEQTVKTNGVVTDSLTVTERCLAFPLPKAGRFKGLDKFWLVLNRDSGQPRIARFDAEPRVEGNEYACQLTEAITSGGFNHTGNFGWMNKPVKLILVRHHSGNFRVDLVQEF